MLNQSGITKVTGIAPVQILASTSLQYAVSVLISNTNIVAGADGKKIVKAGTPLAGNLQARGTAFTLETTTEGVSNAVGVLLHDVDATLGNANGSALISGVVDVSKLDTATAALITAPVQKALNKIIFIK